MNQLTNITPNNVLDLFLQEPAFDNQLVVTINWTTGKNTVDECENTVTILYKLWAKS